MLGLLVFGLVPGSVTRPILFERTTVPLPPSPDHDARLQVVVRALDGQAPLAHARVRVLAIVDDRAYLAGSAETDALGRAELRSLPRAAAWILVDADGYARVSTQRVLADATTSLGFQLPRAHSLDVSVSDDLGAPLPSAQVEVSGTDPLPVGARVDAHGHADIPRLGEGPWIVAVRAPGFEDFVRRGVREGESPKVVLRKLGALVVSVVGEGGAPAPLARVQVAGSSLWPARTTDTSSDGTVRIGGLTAGSYALRASSGALVSSTELGLALARGEERHVVLTLKPGLFAAVDVVEGEDNEAHPIPHARVSLVEAGLSPFPLEGTTDDKGSVRIGPVAIGPAQLAAQADGFVPHGAIALPPDGRTVTITLVRAGAVEGRVLDARGRPVDGATLEIVGTSITGAPIDDDPRKQGFRRAQFDAALTGSRSLVPSGELGVVPGPVPAIPRTFDLPPAATTPSTTASPLDEPWVTRADGTFHIAPASPGRIRVLVHHPEYLDAVSDVVKLSPGGVAQADVVLHEGGSLEGRVTDAAGRPVAGANVTVAALRGSLERSTRTATDGSFAFASVPDGVVVTASVGDDANARVARSTVQVPERGKASLSLTLPDARPPLDVHVRDDRGYPIGAAQVSVGSVDPTVPFRTTVFTDAHGEATIPGARGVALRLEIAAPGHATRAVPVGQDDLAADVTLTVAESISGTVRQARSGESVSGAEVALYSDGGVRRTVTDSRGRFVLSDVTPGAARLRIRAHGRVTRTQDLTLKDTTSHVQDIGYVDLSEEGTIDGTVVDARGEPVAGARVGKDHAPTYVPANTNDASFAVTNARGAFHLGGIEDGSVSIEAYAPDVGRGRVESVRVSAGRVTNGITVRLVADDGERVTEPSSSGGVAITLGELSGEPRELVIVAVADGSEAERAGLAPGDVLLTVDGAAVRSIVDARARLSGPVDQDVVVTRRRGEATGSLRVAREPVRR